MTDIRKTAQINITKCPEKLNKTQKNNSKQAC